MSNFGSWDVICGADSARSVLGVDFPSGGPREAGLAELAALLGPGYRFLRTNPTEQGPTGRLSGEAYIKACVEEIREDGGSVTAVLGRGVGSVYAAAIAEGIEGWQEAPALIFFDPQRATAKLLGRALSREIAADMALLSAAEIKRGREVEAEIVMAAHGSLEAVAAGLIESYLEVITAPYERVGLGDPRDYRLTALFAAYISWISAADQIDPSRRWRDSTAIVSSDYSEILETDFAADEQSRLIDNLILFDVSRSELLRSDCVVGTVLDLLAARES
jgi:hypothetical protein